MPLCLCASSRRGISLLEVLISMGVLSVGLLALAMLIPVGRLSIMETGKADRSGACGRAALREVKVRRMLDWDYWGFITEGTTEAQDTWSPVNTNNLPPFCIDPLGVARGLTGPLGGVVQRYTLANLVCQRDAAGNIIETPPLARDIRKVLAEQIFLWQDDKVFNIPADPTLRTEGQFLQPDDTMSATPTNRPAFLGAYSWLLTVVPSAAEATLSLPEKRRFTVSVAVCCRRDFSPDGECRTPVTLPPGPLPNTVQWTGSVQLNLPVVNLIDSPVENLNLKANQWIMLYGANPGVTPPRYWLQWYRVVSATINPDNTQGLTLAGPDWDTSFTSPTAVIITSGEGALGGVVGVYTTTVERE